MNATRIGTFAAVLMLAAMLVPTGAALPAQANQHAVDNADDRSEATPEDAEEASANAGEGAGQAGDIRGPPVDMPSQVPDFVTQIHESIRSFLQGDITPQELSDSIRSATPDDETAGNETAVNETAEE